MTDPALQSLRNWLVATIAAIEEMDVAERNTPEQEESS
jgi:hypothetical protein